eukprot:scaffold556_cov221-Pinguiococcus_pyrenoidosus.AAC.11
MAKLWAFSASGRHHTRKEIAGHFLNGLRCVVVTFCTQPPLHILNALVFCPHDNCCGFTARITHRPASLRPRRKVPDALPAASPPPADSISMSSPLASSLI